MKSLFLFLLSVVFFNSLRAQEMHGMQMPEDHAESQDHAGASEKNMGVGMRGMFSPGPMARESSGTSWQPASTPIHGLGWMNGEWMFMLQGSANANFNSQHGPRGETQGFSNNMLMGMAYGPLGPGTAGLRAMASLEPAMGPEGYALLLQTGETADGKAPLVDRQHPHDLLMELAAAYSLRCGPDGAAFAYIGYPGEPALGPPAFMHRFSGQDIPVAPLGHHWIDSTHITYGVATVGGVLDGLKLEASSFTGREPDASRWDFDSPKFDSYSGRLSWNPSQDAALQFSAGHLVSPEQLEPALDQDRLVASAILGHAWGSNYCQSTLAWGQNRNSDGRTSNAYLAESSLVMHDTHTLLARAESVEKEGLLPTVGQTTVYAASLGYICDLPAWRHLQAGIGGLATADFVPQELAPSYGSQTPVSYLLFLRLRIV